MHGKADNPELGSPKELELDDEEFDELQADGEVVFLTRHDGYFALADDE